MMLKHIIDTYRYRKSSPEFKRLHQTLKRHHHHVVHTFHHTHGHAKRLLQKYDLALGHLHHGGKRAVAGAALAGSLFVTPVVSAPTKPEAVSNAAAQIPSPSAEGSLHGPTNPSPQKMTQKEFGERVKEIMASSTARDGKLSDAQFEAIQKLLDEQLGVKVGKATDSGFELNKHYGYTGREQYLPSKPGDTINNHLSPEDPTALASGLTPGRGAWGYVDRDEGKYYLVGQTMFSEQFGTPATNGLGGQRYIIIEIPEDANGNYTMVGRGGLWDAGPGKSTGKVFGAAPAWFHQTGPGANRASKFKAIMLPEQGERKPTSELGPLNDGFKQP